MNKRDFFSYSILCILIAGSFLIPGKIGGLLSGFFIALLVSLVFGKPAYKKSVDKINKNIVDILSEERE